MARHIRVRHMSISWHWGGSNTYDELMMNDDAQHNIPTIFVIFGATGDLTRRKLLPALFDLYVQERLPTTFRIIGFADTAHTDASFQVYVRDVLAQDPTRNAVVIAQFCALVQYQQGLFGAPDAYRSLAQKMVAIEESVGQCMNKLFHLAVPPQFYETLLTQLAHSGLTIPCSTQTGWTRVLIEKPFGRDLQTAQALDLLLAKLFAEEQIFRIDHYLAKETIQNILTFRFSNALFEPLWNARHIEKVVIRLHETLDVAQRGAFYDGIGALRDVGQNHALQMLSLIAMEHPGTIDATAIRRARADVLVQTRVDTASVVLAQYEGYRATDGVADDSRTETFFRLRSTVQNERWQQTPFIIEAGKALAHNCTDISIYFMEITPCFCTSSHGGHRHQNILTFRIQPEEGITMHFFAKRPGLTTDIQRRTFDFNYRKDDEKEVDAYAKLLFDCVRGDQTLFASTDEVTAAWRVTMPVLHARADGAQIAQYAKGADPATIIS